jgi:hypothetical protein
VGAAPHRKRWAVRSAVPAWHRTCNSNLCHWREDSPCRRLIREPLPT